MMWCIRLVKRRFLSFLAASRILSSPLNASPCLCVQFAVVSSENFPWSPAFPPVPPPLVTQLCSVPSSVLCRCLTSQRRTRQDCGHGPSLADPPSCLTAGTAEISRFSNIEFPRMLRVFDSAEPVYGSLRNAITPCCLPHRFTRSAPRTGDFGAQWLACVSPCQRFTCCLAAARA